MRFNTAAGADVTNDVMQALQRIVRAVYVRRMHRGGDLTALGALVTRCLT